MHNKLQSVHASIVHFVNNGICLFFNKLTLYDHHYISNMQTLKNSQNSDLPYQT